MKNFLKLLITLSFLPVYLLAQETKVNSFSKLKGEYLGQKKPGLTPELFAHGMISTDSIEHSSPSFSPQGDQVLWSPVYRDPTPRLLLLEMKNEGGIWTKPSPPSFASDKYDDAYPIFSYDGKKLYFASRRPIKEGGRPRGSSEGLRIWVVEREKDGWGTPFPLDTTIFNGEDYGFSVAVNGNLYFSSYRDGDLGMFDIFCSKFINGKYQKPEHLSGGINTKYYEDGPFIAPDESYMIFESNRPGGIEGSIDLYIVFKGPDGTWGESKNMGSNINTKYTDRLARVSPDGKYLFFGICKDWSKAMFDIYWVDAKVIEELRPKDLK